MTHHARGLVTVMGNILVSVRKVKWGSQPGRGACSNFVVAENTSPIKITEQETEQDNTR